MLEQDALYLNTALLETKVTALRTYLSAQNSSPVPDSPQIVYRQILQVETKERL
jgi:hypothetical protein